MLVALGGRLQSRDLGSHLGGLRRRGADSFAPGFLEGCLVGGEATFGHLELVELRDQGFLVVHGRGEVGHDASSLGFEACDHTLVDRGAQFALEATLALPHDVRLTADSFPETLGSRQHICHVGATERRQLGLGVEDRPVELGQGRLELALTSVEAGSQPMGVLELGPQGRQFPARDVETEPVELGDEVAVATSGVCLLLEWPQLAPDLTDQVGQTVQVLFGRGQAALGPLLALAVLEDTGRFFDDGAAVLGPAVEHSVDLALGDDDVLLTADAGVRQQILDVQQPTGHAVERVLGVAVAKQRAGDGDFGELDREDAVVVVDGEPDFGATQRGLAGGAGEDHIVHLLGTHGARLLGSQHPRHGVDHVRLAAAVGADDDRDTGLEFEHGGISE